MVTFPGVEVGMAQPVLPREGKQPPAGKKEPPWVRLQAVSNPRITY